MNLTIDLIAAAIIVIGAIVVGFAAVGVLRFPDPFMRMHAATKAAVVGTGLLLFGSALTIGSIGAIVTALLCVWFLLATSPIASHALGRASYVAGSPIAGITVEDALNGVLERHAVDKGPAGTDDHFPWMEDQDMVVTRFRSGTTSPDVMADKALLRHITIWLAGGQAQHNATTVALDLALAADARLTGLTAIDTETAEYRGPLPIGGVYWAQWSAAKRLSNLRASAAAAQADFEDLVRARAVGVATRHEEGTFKSLAMAGAGADLLVVPAEVDRYGASTRGPTELAFALAGQGLGPPVLRVRGEARTVEQVCVLVTAEPGVERLGYGLLHAGLWPEARIIVIPVGDPAMAGMVAKEKLALFQSHGRVAEIAEAFDFDSDRDDVARSLACYDVAVIDASVCTSAGIPPRRLNIPQLALDTVPMALLL